MKRVTLGELYEAVAAKRKAMAPHRVGSRLDAQGAVEAIVEAIKELTAEEGYLPIPGFGIFKTVTAPARHYMLKGEKKFVSERQRLKFKVNRSKEASHGSAPENGAR